MAISNCITLSSLKKQQEKSTLTSYATEIVVPTPIIGDWVGEKLKQSFWIEWNVVVHVILSTNVVMHGFVLVLVRVLITLK